MKRDLENNNKNKVRYLCLTSEIPKGKSKSFSISNEKGQRVDVAVFNINGKYHAISDTCVHKGGPLSQGNLEEEVVTCPWHGWKYNVRTGKSPHEGGDSVDAFVTKVIGNDLYINPIPSTLGDRVYTPHKKYKDLENSVKNHLRHLDKDSTLPVDANVRVLGISTTNSDNVAPRKSTSEGSLNFALDYAKNHLGAECVLIKLRQLNFKHCEGYYSKNANACIFPCSISERDKEDQMIQIYEKVILWADVVLIATQIRWGSASSLYYKMIQRMNCVQNQTITHNRYLIRDKVASFIITGGQDNVQHVAGELMSFWAQLGFVFGKFPFVGWTRGWYAEDTENNYNVMMASLSKSFNNNYNQTEKEEVKEIEKSSQMYKDIVKAIHGAVEMALLIKRNRYDQKVLQFKK